MPTTRRDLTIAGLDGHDPAQLTLDVIETSAGYIGLACSRWGLVGLRFPQASSQQAWDRLQQAYLGAQPQPCNPHMAQQLAQYLNGKPLAFQIDCDVARYTAFQCRVWQATATIPYGETRSYAWIAQQIDAPNAFRAVGAALGINPIPIIIPCHRVLRSDGDLGGYRGGQAMKQRLLAMEKQMPASEVQELWQTDHS